MSFSILLDAVIGFCLCLALSACGKDLPASRLRSGGSPREVLIMALKARMSAKSYHIQSTQTGTGGLQSNIEGEYVAPDRYHVIAQMSLGGRDSGQQEINCARD